MTQIVESLPCDRQESIYSAYSVSWLLMFWQHKEPEHQQLSYWPSLPWIIPEGYTASPHMSVLWTVAWVWTPIIWPWTGLNGPLTTSSWAVQSNCIVLISLGTKNENESQQSIKLIHWLVSQITNGTDLLYRHLWTVIWTYCFVSEIWAVIKPPWYTRDPSLYPRPTKLEGGYTGFTLSVRLSVCPSVCL